MNHWPEYIPTHQRDILYCENLPKSSSFKCILKFLISIFRVIAMNIGMV